MAQITINIQTLDWTMGDHYLFGRGGCHYRI